MTIRRLLMIFPAYLIGILLAGWWEGHTLRVNYRYVGALNDVRQAYLQLEYVEEWVGLAALEEKVIDQWLDGSLPPADPAWRLLVESIQIDPWGNPYRGVRNLMLDDGRLVTVGVYSTGRDGISRTQGNDPDDLNSWDKHTGSYYRAAINEENRKRYAIQGLFLAPFTYVALLGAIALAKWLRPTRHLCPNT